MSSSTTLAAHFRIKFEGLPLVCVIRYLEAWLNVRTLSIPFACIKTNNNTATCMLSNDFRRLISPLKSMSRDMRFPTIRYVRSAKAQNIMRIRSLIRAFASRLYILWLLSFCLNISLKGGCTGSSESTLVKMQHCWKSQVAAQLLYDSYM